jgi:hypothetical protein
MSLSRALKLPSPDLYCPCTIYSVFNTALNLSDITTFPFTPEVTDIREAESASEVNNEICDVE